MKQKCHQWWYPYHEIGWFLLGFEKNRYCILSQICGDSFILDSTWRFQPAVSQHLKLVVYNLCIPLPFNFLEGWEAGAGDPKKNHLKLPISPRGNASPAVPKMGEAKATRGETLSPVGRRFSGGGWSLAFSWQWHLQVLPENPAVVGFLLSSLLPSQKIELRIVGVLKSHLLESVWSHEAIEQYFMFVFVLQSQCFGIFSCQWVL